MCTGLYVCLDYVYCTHITVHRLTETITELSTIVTISSVTPTRANICKCLCHMCRNFGVHCPLEAAKIQEFSSFMLQNGITFTL